MVLRGYVTTVLLSLTLTLVVAPLALAQSPTAVPGPGASPILIDPLDPRAGEGASQVGAPFLALVVVIVTGLAAAGLTFGYVRLVRSR